MGYEYHHRSIQHHHRRQFHQKNIFLPMFCRLSIKDIIKPNNHHHKDPTFSDDPSSPKVSCMGQVRRSNRIAASTGASAAVTHRHKYSKLKKLFSSKALLPPATTSSVAAAGGGRTGSRSCGSSREICRNNLRRLTTLKNDGGGKGERDFVKLVNIGELDPPLPVVKRAATPWVGGGEGGGGELNLWKRRFNGAPLKSLKIEQIHLPKSNCQPPTVL